MSNLRVVTLNANGIRSAFRKGLARWLVATRPDIVCVQELKVQEKDLTDEMLCPAGLRGYFCFAQKPGYSGVAVYTRTPPLACQRRFGHATIDDEGRFIRLDFARWRAVSLYLPSGSSGEVRQDTKYEVMTAVARRLQHWQRQAAKDGRAFLLCGDFNIAHTQKDIRNWRGNQKNSGFLPEERAWMSRIFARGKWVDVFRQLNDNDAEYTWWSNRGQAWAKNVGWRIDYQIASPSLAAAATAARIYKTTRFSDHAPLIIDYQF